MKHHLARFWTRARAAGLVAWLALAVVAVLAIAGPLAWNRFVRPPPPLVPYSELAAALSDGQVTSLQVSEWNRSATVIATLRDAGPEGGVLRATLPAAALRLEDLERWSSDGATVEVVHRGGLSALLPLLVALGVVAIAGLAAAKGSQRFGGRFRATPTERHLTLADVGGAREARADLEEVVAFLRDPGRFTALGARCPTGVLLVGPPGTGKTLLARAVAGESGRPVILASGSEFTEMFVGVGARRVRELVRKAKAQAPCIVFIDEFDSLGGRRGRPNRTSEEETTLNQLLVEMDGASGSSGIVWMAATNREDMLDPAVRRPGRFDRVVEVGLPTAPDRLEILRIHAAGRPVSPEVDLDRLARLTVGHSGADLANLLNEASIRAAQAGSATIRQEHVEQARDKILLGRLRAGVVIAPDERRLTALHEAGHAIVGLIACPEDRLHKVTIEPRGHSLGAAHFAPDADRHLYTRRYLEGCIAKALGGRAAELVFLGPDAVTSGAGSDLVQATRIARRMVGEFGMSPEIGLVSAVDAAHEGRPSPRLQGMVDDAARNLIATQAERAEALVTEHRAAVEAVAERLLQQEVLGAEEVIDLARAHGVPLANSVTAGLVAA